MKTKNWLIPVSCAVILGVACTFFPPDTLPGRAGEHLSSRYARCSECGAVMKQNVLGTWLGCFHCGNDVLWVGPGSPEYQSIVDEYESRSLGAGNDWLSF